MTRLALLALAVLLSSCANTPAADPRVQAAALNEAERLNAVAATQAQEANTRATQAAGTATALPQQQTSTAQVIQLQDIEITKAWDGATAEAAQRATEVFETQVAKVATDNEGARRALDDQKIYNEQQRQKELDAKLTPWFIRLTIGGAVIVAFVIALWIGKAHEKRIRSDADNSQVKAVAEADATRLIAAADARKKHAEAKRLEMVPVTGGVYYRTRQGGYEFLPMADAGHAVRPALAPVPPMRGEPIRTYPKVTADVLDFLDACLSLMGDDPRRLPSAEAINNSTLRDNGLGPLMAAGMIHTASGRNGGTFILGYECIADLRAAVEGGLIPFPSGAGVVAE